MGSADIANVKHEGDRTFREVAGDAFFAVLLMASNFKNRMMKPLGEGVPVPRLRRTAIFAGQVVNKVDVSIGERRPVRAIKSIGNQLLVGIGAVADGESAHRLVAATADSQTTATGSDLLFEVPLDTYCENGDMSAIVDALQKGGVADVDANQAVIQRPGYGARNGE